MQSKAIKLQLRGQYYKYSLLLSYNIDKLPDVFIHCLLFYITD